MVGRLNIKIRHVLANLRKIPILFAGNTHFYLLQHTDKLYNEKTIAMQF